MRDFKSTGLLALILLLVAGPALAGGGSIARVSYYTPKDGADDDLAKGFEAHNGLHARNNDPVGIFTGIVVNGKKQGTFVRGSLGHDWADFDAEAAVGDEDAADIAANVDPYVASMYTVFYEHLADLSRPAPSPLPMARAIYFHLEPSGARDFSEAVGKIHAALSEQEDWLPYDWYAVVDGGSLPTWVVVLPRGSWADYARNPEIDKVMAAKYGEDAPAIWDQLNNAVESMYSHTMVFPPELSYTPASE